MPLGLFQDWIYPEVHYPNKMLGFLLHIVSAHMSNVDRYKPVFTMRTNHVGMTLYPFSQ